jgi:ketosteroid isomerase-like protein
MRRISAREVALPATSILVGLLCGCDVEAAPELAPDTDLTVREFWETLDARWNERDAARFSSLFTEDVSFEFVDRDESLDSSMTVREYFGTRFPTFAPELRHRTTVRDLRSLAPDVLAVDGRVEILREHSGETAPALLRTFAIFAVMIQGSEGWRVRLIRIYRLPEPPPAEARSAISPDDPRPAESWRG